jgi:Family of unknown function (DUF6404)
MGAISKTHRQKLTYFQKMLHDRKEYAGVPFLWVILWKMGFEVSPPHFMPYLKAASLAAISSSLSSTLLVLVVSFFQSIWHQRSIIQIWSNNYFLILIVVSLIFPGIITGLLKAVAWRKDARKMQLPKWRDFLLDD